MYRSFADYLPLPVGSEAVRGQFKVLYPVTRWSKGQNPIGVIMTVSAWSRVYLYELPSLVNYYTTLLLKTFYSL